MTKGIYTLAIMLTILGCLIIGGALAISNPPRVYWLFFMTELILICAGFLTAWSSGDALVYFSVMPKHGFATRCRRKTMLKMLAFLFGSVLLFIGGIWIHQKPRGETSIQQLVGMEGAFAQASHDAMQLFILACLAILCFRLILSCVQRVLIADQEFLSAEKKADERVRCDGIPVHGNK